MLSPDEDFVLVVESFRYRVRRLWLQGRRVGETDLFADNLIDIPNNIERGEDGT